MSFNKRIRNTCHEGASFLPPVSLPQRTRQSIWTLSETLKSKHLSSSEGSLLRPGEESHTAGVYVRQQSYVRERCSRSMPATLSLKPDVVGRHLVTSHGVRNWDAADTRFNRCHGISKRRYGQSTVTFRILTETIWGTSEMPIGAKC